MIVKVGFYRAFMQLIATVCIFASPGLFAYDVHDSDQEGAPCVGVASCVKAPLCTGRGLYRSFSIPRRIRLSAEPYVAPDLSKTVVFRLYTLQEVMESVSLAHIRDEIQSGEIKHLGISIPSNEKLDLTNVPIRCLQDNESNAMYRLKVQTTPSVSPDTLTPFEWLQNLDKSSMEKLYVLVKVEEPVRVIYEDGKDIRISWNPNRTMELDISN